MTIKIAFLNFVIAFLKEYLYRKHICISSTELNYYIYAYGILPEMFELDYNGKWYYMPSFKSKSKSKTKVYHRNRVAIAWHIGKCYI